MIGVGAPFILAISVIAALLTCVLHFLSVRRPPVLVLPTMRFLPERPVRAVSRNARPSDLRLLLMRVAAMLLAGVALSGVRWHGFGVKHGRIVVVAGAWTANGSTLTTALSGAFAGDTTTRIVVQDGTTHILDEGATRAFRADTFTAAGAARGTLPTLSTLMLAATRSAGQMVRSEPTLDAIDLVIVAPLVREALDAAVPVVRAAWPGRIELRDVLDVADTLRPTGSPATPSVTFTGAEPSDAVASAFAARGWTTATPGQDDATSASRQADDVLKTALPVRIDWPADGVPAGWTSATPDTVGALVARGQSLVFPFVRGARAPDSLRQAARPVMWWSDGEVAATELRSADSCTRQVGVRISAASNVLQAPKAREILRALVAPCGGELSMARLSTDQIRALEGAGLPAPASAFASTAPVRTPWAAALLALALLLLIAEWLLRDRVTMDERGTDAQADAARNVA